MEPNYEATAGNIVEEATKLHLNTLVSLVKAAGLSEIAENSTHDYTPTTLLFVDFAEMSIFTNTQFYFMAYSIVIQYNIFI